MIRIATPTVSQELLSEQTNFFRPFDQSRHGLFGPADGLTPYDRPAVQAALKSLLSQTSSNATR
jgi:hypothetical protein